MGGAFTDSPKLTWRWCFYINLPFGLITTLFVIFCFTAPKTTVQAKVGWKAQLGQMDLHGTALFLPGVVCLLLALSWGGTQYPWKSARIIVLLVLAVLLLVGFVAIQIWKGNEATVPPRVFKNRNVFGSAIFAFCVGGSLFVLLFYVSCKSCDFQDSH
jgi:MFS family permease